MEFNKTKILKRAKNSKNTNFYLIETPDTNYIIDKRLLAVMIFKDTSPANIMLLGDGKWQENYPGVNGKIYEKYCLSEKGKLFYDICYQEMRPTIKTINNVVPRVETKEQKAQNKILAKYLAKNNIKKITPCKNSKIFDDLNSEKKL